MSQSPPGSERESTVLPGDLYAVRYGALFLAVAYLLLIPAHAVMLTGHGRITMVALTAIAAVASGVMGIAVPHASERGARWLLGGLFAIPLTTTETHLAVTQQWEQTAPVMLVVVAIGAIAVSRTALAVGVAGTVVAWVAIVLIVRPQPMSEVGVYAFQLLVASSLSVGVFVIRARVFRRLSRVQWRLRGQRDEMAALRAQAAADLDRLQELVYASPVGLTLSDEHGRLVQVNRAICQMVGLSEAQLLGHSAAAFTHVDDLEFISRSGQAILDSPDGIVQIETRYVRADGEVIWVWLTLTHVAGPAGEVYTMAHVQDVTERKKSEANLRQSNQVIEAAQLVAHAVQLGEDPRRVIVEQTLIIASATSVQFIERLDADHLVVTASSGDPHLAGVQISLDEVSMCGQVWRSAETVFLDEAADDPMASPRLLAQTGAHSTMWAPVLVDAGVAAIIAIVWSKRVDQVSDLQRTAVDTVVSETAMALMSERLRQSLEESSVTDPLTGLLNRRGWERQVAATYTERGRPRWPTVIALLDFDHFKAYNDTLGHAAGDSALSGFGAAVRAALRAGDLVARWGGEEFAIALPDCPLPGAESALRRLASCVPPELTCSIGYTVLGTDGDVIEAMRRADQALYVAKNSGRNQIRAHQEPVAEPSL